MRREVRRLGQLLRYRRLSFVGVPKFFANSFPKSGTHLLTQVLQGFPRIGPAVDSGLPAIVQFEPVTGRERRTEEILDELRRLRSGDISYGHLHAAPEAIAFFTQEDVAAYFMLRDPRDVVISHVHYVTEMESNHIHHEYYNQELTNFDERLRTSIAGIPDPSIPFPDIFQRFEPYLGWLDHREVQSLHYEELMTDQEKTLGRILEHAVRSGFPEPSDRGDALHALAESIDPQRSPTFRRGQVGGWRNSFNSENKRLFKDVAGELLIRLGYERDHDW